MAKKAAAPRAKAKAKTSRAKPTDKPALSHLDTRGQAHMGDVCAKSQN